MFSGAGGLDLGLEAAGFGVIGCVETDPDARETLRNNRPNWTLVEPADVVTLSKRTVDSLDLEPRRLALLAGGPPCQPFSKAGQWRITRRPVRSDPRARTLRGYFRLVEDLLPSVFLIENVRGFIEGPRSPLPLIRRRLRRINERHQTSYTLSVAYLDSADYGVPQHRRRAFVVGCRDGQVLEWPTPTTAGCPITAWDALGDEPVEANSTLDLTGSWAELIPSIPPGHNYQWHSRVGGGLPLFGWRRRYWSFLLKLDPEKPAWTLPAQPGPATGPFHWSNRRLAITELLRLQSMPPSWAVSGSRMSQVRQVGNATPSLLAEQIGRAIASQIFGIVPRTPLRYEIGRRPGRPTIPAASAVPARYLELELNNSDHPGVGKGPAFDRAS